jgi:hypothetical protein
LLFKGINGDLDHWVLGDSFLKTLYLVFDADNYKVGIITNPNSLGWDHEDLVSIYKTTEIITNDILIVVILGVSGMSILLLLLYQYWVKRRKRITL